VKTQTILAAALAILPSFGRDLPSITLRVVNEAQVDARVLSEARKEATGILNRAGVGLTWLNCAGHSADREPCERPRGRADFWFRLTSGRPAWTSRENLGFTELVGEDGSAGINYPAVLTLAEKLYGHTHGATPIAAFTPGFLGAAIAHEIGHLILGAQAHHPEGVMRAEWGREQFDLTWLGGLNFARDQAKLLQSEVKRRLSEQPR
jgi:hypothetical protein